jgi:hypothetical protein
MNRDIDNIDAYADRAPAGYDQCAPATTTINPHGEHIMPELIELTDTEIDIVSGGAAAAAAAGPNSASAAAAHNLGIVTSGPVTGINFGATLNAGGPGGATVTGVTTDAAVAYAT